MRSEVRHRLTGHSIDGKERGESSKDRSGEKLEVKGQGMSRLTLRPRNLPPSRGGTRGKRGGLGRRNRLGRGIGKVSYYLGSQKELKLGRSDTPGEGSRSLAGPRRNTARGEGSLMRRDSRTRRNPRLTRACILIALFLSRYRKNKKSGV